jgi:RNA polymerase sigma-70 factor (ECF subfamily)
MLVSALSPPAAPAKAGLQPPMTETSTVLTDAEAAACLAAVAQRKDREAYARLFRFYMPRIASFLQRGGAAPDQAQELAQEALISVWRRAESFDPSKASAATWIYTIARNKRIDALRRTARSQVEAHEAEELLPPEPESADLGVIRDQAQARIRAVLSTLAPEQVDVVRKAFFEDKTHIMIAEEMKLPLGTVKSRIRLALTRMRAGLRGDEL